MIPVINRVESLTASNPNVITVAAATPTDVLPDRRADGKVVAYRWIQNMTGTELFFAYSGDCSLKNGGKDYHGSLLDRQQLSVPAKVRVSVYSVAGGDVATAEFFRNDL